MKSIQDYLKHLNANDAGEREYKPVYIEDGDCLVYYSNDRPCHAVRLDGIVTVFIANDNGDVVGCEIKDITKQLKALGPFAIEITQDPIKMGFIFLAMGVQPTKSALARTLFESDMAMKDVEMPAELCGV